MRLVTDLTITEHTLLVTEDGIEVLTARLPNSPGGPVPLPGANGEEKAAETKTEV